MILAGIAFMVVLALLISGVAVAVIWSGKSAVPVAQPTPVPEVPAPVDVPKPIPVAVPVPIPTPAAENIDLTSDPEGAEVWEGNTLLCVTPCSTEHPASAPLPRDFVFKKSGYLNTDYAMASLEDVHSVRLRRKRTSPKPKPAPGPRLPEISFER